MSFITFDLVSRIFFDSGFTIKSKYLCLNLVSLSFNPCHFSGNDLKLLDSIVDWFTLIESSPFLVLITSPFTAIMSPISKFSKSLR